MLAIEDMPSIPQGTWRDPQSRNVVDVSSIKNFPGTLNFGCHVDSGCKSKKVRIVILIFT